MLLVLILLGILIFILLLILVLIMSTVKVNVRLLNISNVKVVEDKIIKQKLKIDYNINVGIYIFNKIKIFGMTFRHDRKQEIKILKFFKIDNEQVKTVAKKMPSIKEIINVLKILKLDIEQIDLRILFDTEDVLITTGITTLISSIIPIILNKGISDFKKDKHKFIVKPLYINKNIIKISLNCIICIKMVHIIDIIFIVLKKKVRIKNGRTSNTRNDDNSNGKYQRYDRCEHNYR